MWCMKPAPAKIAARPPPVLPAVRVGDEAAQALRPLVAACNHQEELMPCRFRLYPVQRHRLLLSNPQPMAAPCGPLPQEWQQHTCFR